MLQGGTWRTQRTPRSRLWISPSAGCAFVTQLLGLSGSEMPLSPNHAPEHARKIRRRTLEFPAIGDTIKEFRGPVVYLAKTSRLHNKPVKIPCIERARIMSARGSNAGCQEQPLDVCFRLAESTGRICRSDECCRFAIL